MTVAVVSLIICLLFLAAAVWRTGRAYTFLSAHLILTVVITYTLFLPSLESHAASRNDVDFNALLLTAGALILVAVLLISPVAPSSITPTVQLPQTITLIGAASYACWLAVATLSRIYTSGGLIPALSHSRLDSYLRGGITSPTLDFLLIVPQMLLYITLGTFLNRRRYVLFSSLVFLLTFHLLLHANTRLAILFPSLAAALVILNRRWGKHAGRYLLPVIAAGAFFVLLGSYVGAFVRSGSIDAIGTASFGSMMSQSRHQLGYYDWLYDLFCFYRMHPSTLEHGATLWYYPIASLIPRFFWPSKPLTSVSNRLTESIYGVTVGEGTEIFTFTLIGEGFSQFGSLGGLLWCPLFLLLVTRCERYILRFHNSEYLHGMFLINMIPFVRAELPVVKSLVIVITLTALATAQRRKATLATNGQTDAVMPHLTSRFLSHPTTRPRAGFCRGIRFQ